MALFSSRDDRRRRLLTDESRQSAATEAAETPATRRSSAAKEAAARMNQIPRITDLVPRSVTSLALWFFAGVAIVAGLEALYHYSPQWSGMTTDGHIAAFDLDDEGSLAVWFSSTTLFLCTLMAMLVYLVRRQQPDDYHGRYRVWLWAAACWLIMSIDEGSSLHEGFKELMTKVSGQRIYGDGSIWWVAAYGLVLSAVGMRLLLEMRTCISSTFALVLAGGCYVAAVITQMELVLPQTGAFGVMIEEGCEMVGNVFLLLSMTLHARYVIMDIEGLVPKKNAKADEEKKPRRAKVDSETTATAAKRSDLATPAKAAISSSTLKSPTSSSLRVDPPQETARKLSKSERRAIRRQLRDEDEDE